MKYRFKHSDYVDNWETIKLDELGLDISTGKKDANEGNPNGKYKFFTCAKEDSRIDHTNFSGESLLIAGNGNIGQVKYYNGDFDAYQRVYVIQNFNSIHAPFLKEVISCQLDKVVRKESMGSTLKYIRVGTIKDLIIPLPSLPEQEKIAGFFGALDERIRVQEEIIEKLKDQKQGYLQKIFNQELRFRDDQGNQYPDWETKKLGEVADIVGGGTPSTNREEFWNGDILWITPAEVKGKYTNSSKRKITLDGLENSSAKILPAGSIILTSRATLGEMSILQIPSSTNQGFQNLIPKNITTTNFLYALQSQIKKYCERYSAGSTFKEISKKEISKMEIPFPSYFEQVKIGDFFAKLDDRITTEDVLLQNLCSKKHSYLQNLF